MKALFAARGLHGISRLANRLNELVEAKQIAVWHIGHWTDYRRTDIYLEFATEADAAHALADWRKLSGTASAGSA